MDSKQKGLFFNGFDSVCSTSLKKEKTPVVLCIRQDRGELQSPFTPLTSTLPPAPILQRVA